MPGETPSQTVGPTCRSANDPVLALVPAGRRDTLIADPGDDGYRFDIRIQGERETVFFDV